MRCHSIPRLVPATSTEPNPTAVTESLITNAFRLFLLTSVFEAAEIYLWLYLVPVDDEDDPSPNFRTIPAGGRLTVNVPPHPIPHSLGGSW
ncbi:hypothetical protein AVEN_2017-1 [Araneus ventricosus]|uniref:Uncharacterized protein n=1 Tax=Araneus ventricosus TaxID=182803 RepID=A0A4Y2RSU3_ARAVE|nr:hypothetical protein AVEN_2017-1 [Araneus ventricosus]